MDQANQTAMAMSFDPNKELQRAASETVATESAKPRMKERPSRGSEADLGALLTSVKYRDGATVAEVNLCADPPV